MHTVHVSLSALSAAAHFSADKDVRYYLNGVMLEYGPQRTIHCGTDGHILGAFNEDMSADQPNIGHGQAIIPSADVKRILRDAKGLRYLTVLPLSIEHKTDGGGTWKCEAIGLSGALVDGRFPDWRRVIPDYATTTDRAPAQFNPLNLARVQKAFVALGSKAGSFTLMHRGENNSALCVNSSYPSALAIVVPWRQDNAPETSLDWTRADIAADFAPVPEALAA